MNLQVHVKITNVDGIVYGDRHWDNGDVVQVISTTDAALLLKSKKQAGTFVIVEEEFDCIEFLEVNAEIENYYEGSDEVVTKKKPVVISQKAKIEQQKKALLLDQDYLLASLYDSIQAGDEVGRALYNESLKELHVQLEELK